MTYRFAPSFDQTFLRLPSDRQARVKKSVDRLIDRLNQKLLPAGVGLKRLRGNLWELRAGLGDRIIFSLDGQLATFIMAGTHDEVRRFLKRL